MASAFDRISHALASLGKRRAAQPTEEGGAGMDGDGSSGPKRPRLVFRPWDQADMHRRLETYRPLTWFAKPDIVSPMACAARGWYNEARDQLCCEFCSVRLRYPTDVPFEARDRAAALFAKQLEERHDTHCPWRHTQCDDSVLAFSPGRTTPAGLANSFQARLSKLERCDQLPDMYPRAVQQLASQAGSDAMCMSASAPFHGHDWGNACLRRVLALPPPRDPGDPPADVPPGFDPSAPIRLPSHLTVAQKARLLALLGWEAEELPPGTTGRPHYLSAYRPSSEAYTLAHLLGSASSGGGAPNSPGDAPPRARWAMANVVLNCGSCKSRVGLWNFLPGGAQQAAGPLALPGPRKPPSVVVEELLDDADGVAAHSAEAGDVEMLAAADVDDATPMLQPAPSVPLVRTIAGGMYEPALHGGSSGGGATPCSGGGQAARDGTHTGGSDAPPVFGNPLASSGPVYGLSALSLPVTVPGATSRGGSSAGGAAPGTGMHVGIKRPGDVPADDGHAVAALSLGGAPPGEARKAPAKRLCTGSAQSPGGTHPPTLSDTFDPLSHHRAWCPWVFTGNAALGTPGAKAPAAGTPAGAAVPPRTRSGWMHLLHSLSTPPEDAAAAPPGNPAGSVPATPPDVMDTDGGGIVPGAEDGTPARDMRALRDSILQTLQGF